MKRSGSIVAAACFIGVAFLSHAVVAEQVIPSDSQVGSAKAGQGVRLITPLASDSTVDKAGWKMNQLRTAVVTEPAPKLGSFALQLGAEAQDAGGKGDFTVANYIPGDLSAIGLWVHLAGDANVQRVGMQIVDAEEEAFLLTRPAEWKGWRWVEFDLTADGIEQAWKQPERNGRIDFPLRSVHVAWFAAEAGPTQLTVNALAAAGTFAGDAAPTLAAPDTLEPGQSLRLPLVISNSGDAAATVNVRYEIQRDPTLALIDVPDARHGTDHAAGALSWTEANGERIESGSLTDRGFRTSAGLPNRKDAYTEAFQFIDLGEVRRLTHLAYESGDANHVFKLDIAASADGQAWADVPALQGVDLHKQWGRRTIAVPEPFEARHLRLRYHRDGQAVSTFTFPSRFSAYDGTADETWALPQAGPVLSEGDASAELRPGGLQAVEIQSNELMATGAYRVAARVERGERVDLVTHRLFVLPEPLPDGELEPRVGLNTATHTLAALHQRLGIGWVRFENLKWRMSSRVKGEYKFDGLLPWGVNQDLLLNTYHAHGINVLPYLFMSPEWASSAPADSKHRAAYPPTDYADYGDFVFQTVARYGTRKHDPATLKTEDRVSGLGLLKVVELWNEPNLNDPGWGHFVGPLNDYFEMFRVGAEAAKQADPQMKIANGGFAGIKLELVEQLRNYTYADGKHPLDFVDVLSVHTYTGATPPELSRVDTNLDRSAGAAAGTSHLENLLRLADWRDQHRPGMPIWMTETGFDTGGPRAVSERDQAALSVRNVLLMLGSGIDAVHIYRDTGSTESLYAASGLLRSNGSFKPSWFSMATLIRQIHGSGAIQRLPHDNPDAYLYAWQRGDEWVVAGWSATEPVALGQSWGGARVTDTFGFTDSVADASAVELTAMPVYFSGIEQSAAVAEAVERGKAAQDQWRQARRKLESTVAYLFDFGGSEHIGTADIGGPRPFTPVAAADTYDKSRGYGFQPRAGTQDNDARWIRDAAERDSVRVTGDHSFRADVAPGTYRISLHYSPTGATGKVAVTSGSQTATLEPTRDQKQVSVTMKVTEPVIVQFSGYGDIAWISIVAE